MGSIIHLLGSVLSHFLVLFIIVVLLAFLPPKTHFPFTEFHVTGPKELKGSLALNNHLDGAERLLEDRVYGPECLISKNNDVYTSIHGGEVIKITADHITHVAKFGQPCEGIYEEAKCGRPLGLAFDTIGTNLIVADAYYGIWQVDTTNGRKKLLISPHQTLEGRIDRKPKIFNSVAVDKRGNIYWTDSSSDFTIEDGLFTMLANPSGRLFFYDRANNVSKLLKDDLFFANGLALNPNEDFIVVAETGAARLGKFHIKGPKQGVYEVFSDGLPGTPDNLTPDTDGLWVPLITATDSEHPSLFAVLTPFPLVRMTIMKLFSLFELPWQYINHVFPNTFMQKLIHNTGHFESMKGFIPKRTTIVRMDWNGNILGSLHGFDKTVQFISHVLEYGDYLLLGSPWNRYLGKVKLPKGPQVKIRNVRYEGVESEGQAIKEKITTTTTPPPSTTTTTKASTTQEPETKVPPLTTSPRPQTASATKPTVKPNTVPTTKSPSPAKPTQQAKEVPPKPKPTVQSVPSSASEKPADHKRQSKVKSGEPKTTSTPVKEPAPIKEKVEDSPPPKKEKLKVIKKGGEQGEL